MGYLADPVVTTAAAPPYSVPSLQDPFLLSLHMSTQKFDVFAKLRLMSIMAIKEFVCAYFVRIGFCLFLFGCLFLIGH